MSPILQSLLITAIGMGLVFILIVLLWGFMAALVSLTNRWDFMASSEVEEPQAKEDATAVTTSESGDNKAGIVAVAVAAAIAAGQKVFQIRPAQSVNASSWQAVSRANTLSQISSIFSRKRRG